jgi:hypothetical protein
MKARSLWPREHGAYVQLLAPIVVALVAAPSVAGALIALGAFAAFLAHEPLLVLVGRRGPRARAQHGERARLRLALCAALAAVAGVTGMALAPEVLTLAVAVQSAAVIVLVLSWKGEAHTLGGELAAATTLAGVAAPVGIAGGMSAEVAVQLWVMWALAFASTVVAVHVVIACHKQRATRARWLLWSGLLAASGAGIAAGVSQSDGFAAAVPLWLVAIAVVIARPPATRLRRIGVVLAVVTTATMAWSIAVV